MYRQSGKIVKQQYVLHTTAQYGELQPTNGWDRFRSLGIPANFNGFRVTAATSLTGGQPNFARCLAVPSPVLVHYIYVFGGCCPLTEFCPVQSSLYDFKSQMTRLHQIQNSLTRAVITAPKSCHTIPCLRCLQCLRITERIENTKFSQPPNLHVCVTSSRFNLAALALHLLSLLLVYQHHFITNNWSFLLDILHLVSGISSLLLSANIIQTS